MKRYVKDFQEVSKGTRFNIRRLDVPGGYILAIVDNRSDNEEVIFMEKKLTTSIFTRLKNLIFGEKYRYMDLENKVFN